ncbi:MAG: Wzz/FepE/Etk N-terminal domain-containing protein [Bacteroidota bacterium]
MPESPDSQARELTLRDILTPIWKERKRVAIIAVAVGLVTLGVNFLLPLYYKATAVILPETDKTKLGMMSQFAGLASLAGVNVPSGDVARLYPVMLTSESVLTNVIRHRYASERFKDSVDLIQYFKLDEGSPAKDMDEALKTLKGLMSVSFDNKTSVVTVGLEMREPELAAEVLNTILSELDNLLREKKMSSASEQRKWIESRLVQVEQELREAEERLKGFRERNRRVGDSPQLMLQQERLLRDVQIKGTIDVELKKQAELAKIEEIKQVTTINVLDEARAPVRKEHPKRATNAAIAFLLALLGAGGYFAVKDLYGERIGGFVEGMKARK